MKKKLLAALLALGVLASLTACGAGTAHVNSRKHIQKICTADIRLDRVHSRNIQNTGGSRHKAAENKGLHDDLLRVNAGHVCLHCI